MDSVGFLSVLFNMDQCQWCGLIPSQRKCYIPACSSTASFHFDGKNPKTRIVPRETLISWSCISHGRPRIFFEVHRAQTWAVTPCTDHKQLKSITALLQAINTLLTPFKLCLNAPGVTSVSA